MSGFVTRWLRHLLHPARAVLLATLTSLAAQAQGTGSHVGQAALDAVSSDLGKTAFLVRNWGPNETQAMRILQTPPAWSWGLPSAGLPLARTCQSGAQCDAGIGLQRCTASSQQCACQPLAYARAGEQKFCAGHSDTLLDAMYQVIVSARETVDIFSLDAADGRFLSMLQNAMLELASQRRAVTVRFLFGDYPDPTVNHGPKLVARAREQIIDLTRKMPNAVRHTTQLKFIGGYYWMNSKVGKTDLSWNHAKIIAADGRRAIVGGHNMFAQHYLDRAPVHDLSVQVEGPAAAAAHAFATSLMNAVCAQPQPASLHRGLMRWSAPWNFEEGCGDLKPVDFRGDPSDDPSARGRVIAVGRLALLAQGASTANTGDRALLAMINAARRNVRLSIQDLGPFKLGLVKLGQWPDDVLEAVARAISRGVHVHIVRSSWDSTAGGLTWKEAMYEYGYPLRADVIQVRHQLMKTMSDQKAREMSCRFLHLAPLRMSEEQFWDAPASLREPIPFGNHAKFLMVDDAAFYVGSQNLYDSNNAEFGFIVDDGATARRMLDEYYGPLWNWSKWSTTSGGGFDADCQTRVVELDGSDTALPPGPLRWALDSRLDWTRLTVDADGSVRPLPARAGDVAQHWVLAGDGTLRSARDGQCLGLRGDSKDDRAAVVALPCADPPGSQRWERLANGTLRNRHSGKCLDVAGAEGGVGGKPGALIQFGCHGGANQQWSLRTADGAPPLTLSWESIFRFVNAPAVPLRLRGDGKPGSPGQPLAFTAEPSGRLRMAPRRDAQDQRMHCLTSALSLSSVGADCKRAAAAPTAWLGLDGKMHRDKGDCATLWLQRDKSHLLGDATCFLLDKWTPVP